MNYSWTITREHLGDEPRAVGVVGPRGAHLATFEAITKHPDAFTFKLYDDDGECYYTGKIVVEGHHKGDFNFGEEFFAPLNDYGEPNAGCTRIDYKDKDGVWRAL